MPVIFFIFDRGVNPIAIKVLCKVDDVLQAVCVVAVGKGGNEFFPVVVKLHFQKFC